ncbi:carboxypeptidase-like regulatory domain-containing protein [Nocardioides sp. L-11A]|uniref:carboxypeptidase-like regulatory domain-containing protein n=1 Tax=Nocardioides sp. L-11A TaxID=3043848 RepID=UPI00249A19BC|nr:carboxypeptidase-like regulatory domain-containing protein [Nocardioides sp. L-11A]
MNDPRDDDLMALLGDAVAEEAAVSDRRRTAARAAFTWRSIDAELAELLHDSALDAGAAVRSDGEDSRTLSFGHSGLTLELELDGEALLGQVIAPGGAADTTVPASVLLERPDADARSAVAEASGFFRFEGVRPGTARFVVEQGGWSLTTPWVTL